MNENLILPAIFWVVIIVFFYLRKKRKKEKEKEELEKSVKKQVRDKKEAVKKSNLKLK